MAATRRTLSGLDSPIRLAASRLAGDSQTSTRRFRSGGPASTRCEFNSHPHRLAASSMRCEFNSRASGPLRSDMGVELSLPDFAVQHARDLLPPWMSGAPLEKDIDSNTENEVASPGINKSSDDEVWAA